MANIFNEPYAAIYNRVPRKEVKPGKKQVADFHYIKTIGEGSFAVQLHMQYHVLNRFQTGHWYLTSSPNSPTIW